MPGYDGYQQKPFTCMVGDIECHGNVVQEKWTRHVGDSQTVVFHYVVSVIVAGVRKYTFEMLPAHDGKSHYRVFSIQRRSAVRDMVMESVDRLELSPDYAALAFEKAIEACVEHYKAKPPLFEVPAENVGEL